MRRRRCATANGSTSRSPARPTSSIGSTSATRFLKAGLGAGNAGFLGALVLQDGDRYLMYYSATHDACHDPERGHCLAVATSDSPAGPFVDMGMPLLLGDGVRIYRPDGVRRSGDGKHLLYWGSGFQPIKVQELARTGCRSRRDSSRRPHLAQPGRGRLPAAGRGGLGHPPRRILLSLLLGRQLLRPGRRIWRDGRPLSRADRPVRDARSKRAACRTA